MLSCFIIGMAINCFIGQILLLLLDAYVPPAYKFERDYQNDMKDPGFWLAMVVCWSLWLPFVVLLALVLVSCFVYKVATGKDLI